MARVTIEFEDDRLDTMTDSDAQALIETELAWGTLQVSEAANSRVTINRQEGRRDAA